MSGAYTALVTPFSHDGARVDEGALEALVERQIEAGVSGLVPVGTTGESPTLSSEEKVTVIRCVVKATRGRVPVLAGTGSNATKTSIEASRAALDVGADAVMIVMPYYNKPSQEGMRRHVLEIASAVDCSIVLYNIPGRSVVDLSADTVVSIAASAPNVVGVKEATGNVLRCQELKRRLGDRMTVMSGDDSLTLPMMAAGASGIISVTSNVRPREVSEVPRLMAAGDLEGARRAHFDLLELHAAIMSEPNPAPAKAVLSMEHGMNDVVRGPLVVASDATRARLKELLAKGAST